MLAIMGILANEICTREEFVASYKSEKLGERVASVLDKYNIFPLTCKNPKLVFVNILGLAVYFSGALTADKRNRYDAMISNTKAQQRDLSSLMEAELGLRMRERRESTFDFGENGGAYARLLSLMGFFTSRGADDDIHRKARIGSELPKYLVEIIETYNVSSERVRGTCRKYIRDLVSVCFDAKGRAISRKDYNAVEIELLTQPTEEHIEKQARQIVKAINSVYPKVGLDASNIFCQRINSGKSREKYEGHIHIPLEKAIHFPNYGNSAASIEVKVGLRPSRYSFESSNFNDRARST
jgi:hypothetical protein